MNFKDIVLGLSNNNTKREIHLFLPNNYDCKMDGSVLMVGESGKTLKIVGFYLYVFKKYEDINENNYSTAILSNSRQVENFEYKKENIFNREFKTYCIKYKDDYTVNKVYMYKINDEIVGQVELQYFGAKSNQEYSFNEISPFLSMLINTKVANIDIQNNKMNNQYNNGIPVNPDEVIENLTKRSSTMNMLLILLALYLVISIGFDVLYFKHIFLTIFISVWVIIFMSIYGVKYYLGKRNLKDIDFNEIKKDLLNNCISFPKMKTYFTNNYIISNYYHSFVIKYSDIIWMHPVEKYYNDSYMGTDLVISTKNKRKETVLFSEDILNIILNHNSRILYGNTSDNKRQYKEIIKNMSN